jgi:hypothetical protein
MLERKAILSAFIQALKISAAQAAAKTHDPQRLAEITNTTVALEAVASVLEKFESSIIADEGHGWWGFKTPWPPAIQNPGNGDEIMGALADAAKGEIEISHGGMAMQEMLSALKQHRT